MAKGIWVKLLKGKSSPMEDALLKTWEEQSENVAGHADDAKTLFFVELMHAEFKIDLKIGEDNEKIEVIRWQCPLLHGMLRTAYSAQGLTWDGGVLVDLRRAGGLEDDDWWLAMYVMLPAHGLKVDDNPHLATTTRHVMVGITRRKVIVFFLCFFFVMFLEAMWQWEGQPFRFHGFFFDGAGLPGIFCISFHGRSRRSRVVEVRRRTLAVYDRGWRPENYTSIDPR